MERQTLSDNPSGRAQPEEYECLLVDEDGQVRSGSAFLIEKLQLDPLPQRLNHITARLTIHCEDGEHPLSRAQLQKIRRDHAYPISLSSRTWCYPGLISPLFGSQSVHWHLCFYTTSIPSAHSILTKVPGMLLQFEMDPDGQLTTPYVNQGSLELAGITPQDAMRDTGQLLRIIHPDDQSLFYASLRRSADDMSPWQCEFRAIKGGQVKWLMGHSEPEPMQGGGVLWHGIIVDISHQKELERYLERNCNRLYQSQKLAKLGYWEVNLSQGNMYWSDMTFEFLGLNRDQVTPSLSQFLRRIHPEDRHKIRLGKIQAQQNGLEDVECRFLRPDGSLLWGHLLIGYKTDSHEQLFYGSVRDISKQKQLEMALKQQSMTDPLTLSYNRRYFEQQLEQEMSRFQRNGKACSVIMLDIDFFKSINDDYGHLTGDRVLQGVATTIASRIRQSDVFARIGGEEFALLLPETRLKSACNLAEALREQVAALCFADCNPPLGCSATFGVAQLRKQDQGFEDLLGRADRALYQGKASGRNRVTSETELNT